MHSPPCPSFPRPTRWLAGLLRWWSVSDRMDRTWTGGGAGGGHTLLRWVPSPTRTSVWPPRAGLDAQPADTQAERFAPAWGVRNTPSRYARTSARYALSQGWRRSSRTLTEPGGEAYRAAARSRHHTRRRGPQDSKPGQARRSQSHELIGLNCQSLSAKGGQIFGLTGDWFRALLQVAQKAGAAALCLQGTRWRGSDYVQHAHWHIFHSPVPEGATGADAHTGVCDRSLQGTVPSQTSLCANMAKG